MLPCVQQGGGVIEGENKINTITNQEEGLQPYNIEQVKKAFKVEVRADLKDQIGEDCYKFPGELKFDVDKDDLIDNLTNLHYSNIRTRNAEKNRINKDNIDKWTWD